MAELAQRFSLVFLFLPALALEITQADLFNELEDSKTALSKYESITLESPYQINPVKLENTYIKIRIDPCKGRSNEFCCDGMNEGMCQDNPVISKGPNLPIAWSSNNYIVICNNQFFNTEECGTFIELHYPNSTQVMNEIRIKDLYYSGFKTESLYTRELLPGKYELWWVQRDRTGRWIIYIKQFYIAY